MTDLLFVYGTLMRRAAQSELGRDMRGRLEREAQWIGPATTAGRLYDLGAYPALVEINQDGDFVHGEVWQLANPEATFAWLDPYEGLEAGNLRGGEYERGVRRVTLQGGHSLEAQVYLYFGLISQAHHLPDGRWYPPKD